MTMHEITLPSGVRFSGATSQGAWAQFVKHMRASIAEGMCPRHATPLKPFPAKAGFVSGQCRDSGTHYALELATGDVHEDFTGLPPWAA